MKRIITLFLFLNLVTILFAQTKGNWNSRTCVYTNVNHQITWKLIDEFSWIERPIIANSTLLKMRCDDLNTLVTVTATKSEDGDPWTMASLAEETYLKTYKSEAIRTGMTFLSAKTSKCYFVGLHALKSRSEMKKKYPNQTVYSIHEGYQFYKKGYIYNVDVTVLSILEEEKDFFDIIASELFKNFSIK